MYYYDINALLNVKCNINVLFLFLVAYYIDR